MAKRYKNTVHKNPFREDRVKKPFPSLAVSAVALALVAVILLAVFLASYLGVEHLSADPSGSALSDNRNGIVYELAPMCYEPTAYMNDVYAVSGDTEYHAVRGADPKKYLCTVEDGIYDLYVSTDTPLPALSDFGANYTRICEVGQVAIQTGSINKERTEALVAYYLAAESAEYPGGADAESVLYLKFMSEKYDFIYYNVNYYRMSDGSRYLYDRTAGRCVSLGTEFADILE